MLSIYGSFIGKVRRLRLRPALNEARPPLAMGPRQVSVRRSKRDRADRAVAGFDPPNGRRRIDDSLAVVTGCFLGSHS